MRKVRPGEVPRPLSIWSWGEEGTPILVLGLRPHARSWGTGLRLYGVVLSQSRLVKDSEMWNWSSTSTGTGMGPVLSEWVCRDEGPAA